MSAYESHGKCDEYHTPRYIFDALGLRFDLDVAAPFGGPRHVPTSRWFDSEADGLSREWDGLVWMNPPYGNQANKVRWLEKFVDHGNGIALLPDRTSAPWFQRFAIHGLVCFVSPKIKFEKDDGSIAGQPGTGSVLLAIGSEAETAVRHSGLGLVFVPILNMEHADD